MAHWNVHAAFLTLLICLGVTASAQPGRPGSVSSYMNRVVKNHPFLGGPVAAAAAIPGGYQREYEGGMVFYDNADPNATSEVHGDILIR